MIYHKVDMFTIVTSTEVKIEHCRCLGSTPPPPSPYLPSCTFHKETDHCLDFIVNSKEVSTRSFITYISELCGLVLYLL